MKLNIKCLPILLLSMVLFSACKKYNEQDFDFKTSTQPYVAINDYSSQEVAQGDTLRFDVVVRTALQQSVIITYAIKGGFSLTGTYTLPRNTVEGTVVVPIPAGTVPMGSTSVDGTLNLTGATISGGSISVGRISPDTEKFSVTVTQ